MPEDKSYNVVFRTIIEEGGHAGIITWTSFESKEKFDAWFTPKLRTWYEVVAEGVTSEEAVKLTRQTPIASRLTAARAAATDKHGHVNPEIYGFQPSNALFAIGEDIGARISKLEKELQEG